MVEYMHEIRLVASGDKPVAQSGTLPYRQVALGKAQPLTIRLNPPGRSDRNSAPLNPNAEKAARSFP